MKKNIKVTGEMTNHFKSQTFHLAGEATLKLSEMRKYLKTNKIPYTYKVGTKLTINDGEAIIW